MFPFGFISAGIAVVGLVLLAKKKPDTAIPFLVIGGIIGVFNFMIHIYK